MIDLRNKPIIEGERVILRPFCVDDYILMEACIKDDEVKKFTGSQDDIDNKTLIEWYSTRNEQVNRLDLAIECIKSNSVVGEVVINEYDATKHSMNFRILIGPNGRNRGLGSEATRLICDYIFNHTDLNQLTLGVYSFNPRGIRVYEKAGFVLESVHYGELEYEGETVDELNMVLTRAMWEKLN